MLTAAKKKGTQLKYDIMKKATETWCFEDKCRLLHHCLYNIRV